MTTKTHYEDFGAVFLLPEEVGSSIRWSFELTQYQSKKNGSYGKPQISGEVALTDCARTVTWSEYGDGQGMLIKLDRAIAELQAARKSLKVAVTKMGKLPEYNDDED